MDDYKPKMREDKRERGRDIRWEETKRTRSKRIGAQGVSERKKQDQERKMCEVMCRVCVAPAVKHPFSSCVAHEGIHYKTAPGASLVLMHLLVY